MNWTACLKTEANSDLHIEFRYEPQGGALSSLWTSTAGKWASNSDLKAFQMSATQFHKEIIG